MKIGVLADTHIPNSASDLPGVVYEKFQGVDLILHAGDFTEMFLLKRLQEIAKVIAVKGNMDSERLKCELPETRIVTQKDFRIGITHGYGIPSKTIDNVKLKFEGEDLDIIIFGHSHQACNEVINNTIYFNPGSPTDKVFSLYNSFGIIAIDQEIHPEIIRLEK